MTVSPANTAELIEMPSGLWNRVSQNKRIRYGPRPPWEGAILRGKWRPIVKCNRPCAAAMRPVCQIRMCFVKNASTFVIITLEKNSFHFYNFSTAVSRKNIFTHTCKTCSPHLNNALTLPCENETSHFVLLSSTLRILPTASRVVWNKVHQVQRKQIDKVTRYVQNVHHWHEHKHASVLTIGQLHHQSATARILTTHAAHAVAADQCHERNSDVIIKSRVE